MLHGLLDLHHHGQHHRPPARSFLQEPAQFRADAFFHQTRIGALLDAASVDRLGDDGRALDQHVGRASSLTKPRATSSGTPSMMPVCAH